MQTTTTVVQSGTPPKVLTTEDFATCATVLQTSGVPIDSLVRNVQWIFGFVLLILVAAVIAPTSGYSASTAPAPPPSSFATFIAALVVAIGLTVVTIYLMVLLARFVRRTHQFREYANIGKYVDAATPPA